MISPKIEIAPMLDYTHRHARYFYRLFSPHLILYTEMIVAQAILHQDPERWLAHNPSEMPLILQLGGSDPELLKQAACIAKSFSFSGINLNVGCPSERVKSGKFGACLMAEPELVADCINAMSEAGLPVSVKCRLGIDEQDAESSLDHFIRTLYEKTTCRYFIIHARKAWLKGLNPKQNRHLPPLQYERAYRLQRDFKTCTFILNGGIETISDIQTHLNIMPGVMIGRAVIKRPRILSDIQTSVFQEAEPNLLSILTQYCDYIQIQSEQGVSLRLLLQPLFGLFHQLPNSKQWRLQLDTFIKTKQFDSSGLIHFLI